MAVHSRLVVQCLSDTQTLQVIEFDDFQIQDGHSTDVMLDL